MSAGVERQKIVYPLTRDENVPLKIASPLEANAQFTVNFDIASLDVGWDNPIFAALELSYAEADEDHTGKAAKDAEKMLVYHEFDIGINCMKRTWAESTLRNANRILAVPSGNQNENGPGGSLVLSDGFVAYQKPDHDTLLARIPLRENSAPVIIVAYDTHLQAGSGNFFFIVQSELGDLYKITLDWKGDKVTMLRIYYFDSIPAANALCITRNGFYLQQTSVAITSCTSSPVWEERIGSLFIVGCVQ